jgi:c-di-GMP-binding flagellar brake protein YcgR
MTAFEHRREFTRIPIRIWATFSDGGAKPLTTRVTSLSLKGCHASASLPLAAGGRYQVTLFSQDDAEALHISVKARIVRSDDEGMGVEFMEMPIESYEHLRNLVLLNAPDPAGVEREFLEHIGPKRVT